jgi:hypothetical protein
MEELDIPPLVHKLLCLPSQWHPWQENLPLQGGQARRPLSPMLFLLAMEPLHILFRKAQIKGLLGCLSRSCDTFRVSLYADDAAIFINPTENFFKVVLEIIGIFAEPSGLFTNMGKTECFPIHCGDLDLSFLHDSGIILSQFPCKYLGLPLHYKKPSRSMLHPVVEKVGKRLPG